MSALSFDNVSEKSQTETLVYVLGSSNYILVYNLSGI